MQSPSKKAAAQQLQHYLFEMSNVQLSIAEEGKHTDGTIIYIGNTRYATAAGIDNNRVKEDGILLKPVGNNFIIAGGGEKGVLYAVYHLLEFIGFRKYTSAFTYIPKGKSITFPQKEIVHTPFITYRTTSIFSRVSPSRRNFSNKFNPDDIQKNPFIFFVHLNRYFHGHGITPDGLLIPLNIIDTSHELGFRAASLSFDVVRS